MKRIMEIERNRGEDRNLNPHILRWKKYLNVYSLFGMVFLIYLLFIFQGLDVTDFGFHMTNQISSFTTSVNIKSISPMIFFTDFVGGMWLSLIGEPSVLWARLGGVLVISLTATIIFALLSSYFEKEKVFLVVLMSTLFLTIRSSCYIHYFTFPALLVAIELWIFNQVIGSPAYTKKAKINSFMLGFMAIPIILSRFTLILIFIVPPLILAYYLFTRRDLSRLKEVAYLAIVGLICSGILFGLFYWYLDILVDYFSYLFVALGESASGNTETIPHTHSMASLFLSYLIDSRNIIIRTVILVFGFYLISIVKQKIGDKIAHISIIFMTIGGLVLVIIFGLPIDFFAYNMLRVAIGVILLLSGLFFIIDRGANNNLTLLMIAGLVVMLINPIGSGCGLLKSCSGMWLILPLSVLCAYQIQNRIKHTRVSSMLSLMTGILVAVMILSLFFHATNVYRDDQNRLNLDTEFSHSSLSGIYSTPDRVEVVDELLVQIEKYSNKGDEVLMVNCIPIFYYLTETRPALGNPWLFLNPIEKIEGNQQRLEEEKRYPKLFIHAKVNTRDRNWPNTESMGNEDCVEKLEYLREEYVNQLNYSLLWENKAFAIYGG